MNPPDLSMPAWSLFETLPVGLVVVDEEGRFTRVNSAAGAILGMRAEDLQGMSLFDPGWNVLDTNGHRIPADQFPASRTLRSGVPVCRERIGVISATGALRWIEVSAGPLPEGGVVISYQDVTDLQFAESSLQAERNRSRSMLRTALEGVCLMDDRGCILEANEAAGRILGSSCEDLIGLHIVDFDRSESPEQVAQHLEKIRQNGADSFQATLQRRDGSQIDAEVSVTFLRDTQQLVTYFRDLRDTRLVARKLKEQQDRFQAIVDSVDGIVWEGDAETFVFTYVSAKAERLLGYPTTAWHQPGFWVSHLHPEDRDWAVEFCVSCTGRLEDHDFEYRFQKADGAYIWLRDIVTVSSDESGRPRWLRGVMVDITHQKQAEAALKESETFLRDAQEAGHVGTYSWDIRTNLWKSSPVLDGIFGIGLDYSRDLEGWRALIAPEHRPEMDEYISRVITEQIAFDHEYRILRPDGSLRWVHGRGRLGLDPQGIPIVLAGVIQDITDRKQREAERAEMQSQLMRSQKLESLGGLAGGISHDMNNILGAILGVASIHEMTAPDGSRLQKGMETIAKACERGRDLLKGLLSFTRKGLAEKRDVDLNDLVREQVTLLERTTLQRIQLQTDLDMNLHLVLGDPGELSHALLNLCLNAVDAMPDGGTLLLRTRNVGTSGVSLAVHDTGMGMPQEVLDKAVDPFFTTKPQGKGTGLGLSMVFSTVKAHGGTLRLDSTPGAGTRVCIGLPAHERKCSQSPGQDGGALQAQTPLAVLVIDDDELVRTTLNQILDALGHRATLTSSGPEALDRLQEGLNPDLIILDMNMPGMTGAQTLPLIRELQPDLPVLIATGRADQVAIELCERHSHVSMLPKPFSVKELVRVLPVRNHPR